MLPKELAQLLVGKTIKEVRWHSYLGWPMCVSEIEFTDGTVIDVCGNADEGRFESVTLPNGEFHDISDDNAAE